MRRLYLGIFSGVLPHLALKLTNKLEMDSFILNAILVLVSALLPMFFCIHNSGHITYGAKFKEGILATLIGAIATGFGALLITIELYRWDGGETVQFIAGYGVLMLLLTAVVSNFGIYKKKKH